MQMKKKKIITSVLVMASMASGLLPSSMVSAKTISSMPDSITVVYEEDKGMLPISSSNKKASLKGASDFVGVTDEELAQWQPAAYKSSDATKSWLDSHNGHQTKNIAVIATLDNHPKMRADLEKLLSISSLYLLDYDDSTNSCKNNGNTSTKIEVRDDKCSGTDVNLLSGLYGQIKAYGKNSLANKVLADTAEAKKVREALAKITETDLGLEGNLSSSYLVPIYTYYNIFDNNRGLLPLPKSLNDSISKQDFISLALSQYNFQNTNTETPTKSDNSLSEAFATLQEQKEELKSVADAFKFSEKYSTSKYQQAANTIYFSNFLTGNMYSNSDQSKKTLNKEVSRLEALYDLCQPHYGWGLYTGASASFDVNDYTTEALYSSILNLLDTDIKITTKDFDESDIKASNVLLNYDDLVHEFGDNIESNERVKIKKSTKSDEGKYNSLEGAACVQTINKKIGTKKVKVKVKKWKKVKGKYKAYYVTKTKTVKVTKKITRISYAEVNYDEASIKKLNNMFKEKFTDGSSYTIMSTSQLAEAKEKVNYYGLWATKGYCEAQSKLNAYAVSKKVLTPEMASRILYGYQYRLFCTTKDGALNLYSPVTYNDALTWHSLHFSERTNL